MNAGQRDRNDKRPGQVLVDPPGRFVLFRFRKWTHVSSLLLVEFLNPSNECFSP